MEDSNYLKELAEAQWDAPSKITDIYMYEDGSANISLANMTGFGVDAKYEPSRFMVGQEVSICGPLGSRIKGVKVADKLIFFKTEADLEREHEEWLQKWRAEKAAKYAEKKDEWLKRIDELPEPLKGRMQRFLNKEPDFLLDDQGYELFVVEESIKFTKYFKTALAEKYGATPTMDNAQELFKEFMDLKVEEQKKLVDFSSEHSGNTFGGAAAIGMRVAMGVEI